MVTNILLAESWPSLNSFICNIGKERGGGGEGGGEGGGGGGGRGA